ncbi:hypothetical protein PTSG_00330 [Salpingoeca rosetta]|uniref:Phosphatidylserine decarboxylase n=1 Tax=Salpingoeca rosetta (strain ATCC 50818 / BSB-021) TaxID=946362 RepID=F2TW66_SALR5|nr:uncharacterized protein PTSG_00330 [Salpingoeca rosetta]EGD72312.1 hypothetical protein PTSG_00330 [Salpingoeca rosetta]|eukprot:XP_004998882.1 hypothetical protein PTSG_00330 [Salpingoeca rosetta]
MARLWRRRTAPLALGIGLLGTLQVRRMIRNEEIEQPNPLSPQTVDLILKLPARVLSRAWGAVNEVELPTWTRAPLLGVYARAFDCNMEEAEQQDLAQYRCLQDFFGRYLKRGARPIAPALVNSPADCKVLSYGQIDSDGVVDQVKGLSYRVDKLLGGLLSVAPVAARAVRNLFALNERVVLRGDWDHGHFFYCAVGAYNVGSIRVHANKAVETNLADIPASAQPREFPSMTKRFQKGEEVGAFRLGSTVVLVFEAPEDFHFRVRPGQKLRVGDQIG